MWGFPEVFLTPSCGELESFGRFVAEAYFMANTGIENLKDSKIVDPKKLAPLQIAVLPLR
jgi:hypothetical protein